MVSVAVINTTDQRQLGRKEFVCTFRQQSITEGTQIMNLQVRTQADAMKDVL